MLAYPGKHEIFNGHILFLLPLLGRRTMCLFVTSNQTARHTMQLPFPVESTICVIIVHGVLDCTPRVVVVVQNVKTDTKA
jgi:hypothetical protein